MPVTVPVAASHGGTATGSEWAPGPARGRPHGRDVMLVRRPPRRTSPRLRSALRLRASDTPPGALPALVAIVFTVTVLPVRNLQGGPGFNFTERHAGVSLVLVRCSPDTGSLNTNLNELPV